ncbi:LON peptidase substrate-binding domain-containing protein [Microbacterium sp. VKM Ac-2870]|uniref:LON peptidase substrate-binding domain-containing protein n=1 Tax=Microbacterium sp. VKM Ac-2870 TaxID=2783825 RepID=UPI00188D712B|nr:LON peptidase substrate-binding domain-containing protein [Microbacterium sp. VKM Ac-2870]MBF4562382.1 LON peptidase substrate-binding domain-containing protein [Microbacterium sp. VKM Ac-2870]
MTVMPMFPLGSVLFPRTPLPLRVFEPRYLQLMGELLDSDDPRFGVVLIDRGHETGGGDQRSGIGTFARLTTIAAGADALQVVAIGEDRFTVDRWLDDDPYPRAEVTVLPALEWNDALTPLRVEAEAIVRRVLGRFPDAPWGAHIELSDDPLAAVWQIAAIAPLVEYDQQALLRATTTGGLLRQIIDLTLEVDEIWPGAEDL